MKLLIDTREQLDYACFFEKLAKIHITKTLRIGDYSLEGYETKFSIERKTLNDFIGCTTSSRERFLRELERAKELEYFAIIIECSCYDIINHNYRSKASPNAIISTICSWSVKYQYPIFFVEAREGGALLVVKLAEHFLKNAKS